jgi:uncharacterized membrane protein YedE/YeeE
VAHDGGQHRDEPLPFWRKPTREQLRNSQSTFSTLGVGTAFWLVGAVIVSVRAALGDGLSELWWAAAFLAIGIVSGFITYRWVVTESKFPGAKSWRRRPTRTPSQ